MWIFLGPLQKKPCQRNVTSNTVTDCIVRATTTKPSESDILVRMTLRSLCRSKQAREIQSTQRTRNSNCTFLMIIGRTFGNRRLCSSAKYVRLEKRSGTRSCSRSSFTVQKKDHISLKGVCSPARTFTGPAPFCDRLRCYHLEPRTSPRDTCYAGDTKSPYLAA